MMRFYLGSRTAFDQEDPDFFSGLLKLLLPKFESDFGLDKVFAECQLRGGHISNLKKFYLLTSNELSKKLDSPKFSSFIQRLTDFRLSDGNQQLFRSILTLVDLTPPDSSENRSLKSAECPLAFDRVYMPQSALYIKFILTNLQWLDMRHTGKLLQTGLLEVFFRSAQAGSFRALIQCASMPHRFFVQAVCGDSHHISLLIFVNFAHIIFM